MTEGRPVYVHPLMGRYASEEMQGLWSDDQKFGVNFRKLWAILADAERELGVEAISAEAVSGLHDIVGAPVDFARAAELEREFRHDVMAHVHLLGEEVPAARGIIHLGATSMYPDDNAYLLAMREGVQDILIPRLVGVVRNLRGIAEEHMAAPILAYTHYQKAQPTTFGKRVAGYIQDLLLNLDALEGIQWRARGAKGTTGTQDSFLSLFDGDHQKVDALDKAVAKGMGFVDPEGQPMLWPVTNQTYPRLFDYMVLSTIAGIGVSLGKFGSDMRLMAHDGIVREPLGVHQIGSSAMAYKKNPMLSERLTGLSGTLLMYANEMGKLASSQWLERSLDDSAARRMLIPCSYLTADAVLRIATDITRPDYDPMKKKPMRFYAGKAEAQLRDVLPFMVTERIIGDLVGSGHDRQEMHEIVRRHSHAAGDHHDETGEPYALFERLSLDPVFPLNMRVLEAYLKDPMEYVGRARELTQRFISDHVDPVLKRYEGITIATTESKV